MSNKPTIETLETSFVKESNPVRTVTDASGRVIRYKNLSIMERARLARVLAEHSNNGPYYGMLATAAAVIDIDGEAGPPKTKISFLEGRLEWLGDDGWDAIIADDRMRNEVEENEKVAIKN